VPNEDERKTRIKCALAADGQTANPVQVVVN